VFYDRIYRGLDGVRDYFREWVSIFDALGSEVEEWIDAGDDVIAAARAVGESEAGYPSSNASHTCGRCVTASCGGSGFT
jgi:hypothetical protein